MKYNLLATEEAISSYDNTQTTLTLYKIYEVYRHADLFNLSPNELNLKELVLLDDNKEELLSIDAHNFDQNVQFKDTLESYFRVPYRRLCFDIPVVIEVLPEMSLADFKADILNKYQTI